MHSSEQIQDTSLSWLQYQIKPPVSATNSSKETTCYILYITILHNILENINQRVNSTSFNQTTKSIYEK